MSQLFVSAGPVEVSLVEETTGRTLPLYAFNGRYYVKAVHGMRYIIRVISQIPGRLEVLAGIDGRDTLKNQPADLLMSDGLIISGYDVYNIPGWGKSATTPFIFTAFDRETIAARATGSTKNLGVIAVACFKEREVRRVLRGFGHDSVSKGLETFSLGGNLRGAGMGTGTDDNDVTHRHLGTTTFTRANHTPDGMVEIYAMPEWWLEERGILPEKRAHDRNHPAGFTGGGSDYGLR